MSPAAGPRRARYLIPDRFRHRGEVLTATGIVLAVGHALFAPTVALVGFGAYVLTRLIRLRWSWLFAPLGAGVLLAIVVRDPLGDFTRGPRAMVDALAGLVTDPGGLVDLPAAYGHGRLLDQLPVALLIGVGECGLALFLNRLHTDEWDVPEPRRGMLAPARGAYRARRLRQGRTVGRTGARIGVEPDTGRWVTLRASEVAGGVACVGAVGSGVTTSAFQLVHAAIRGHDPVVVLDLVGAVGDRLRAACAAVGTPLYAFGTDGPDFYAPLRGLAADDRREVLLDVVDWPRVATRRRRSCGHYLDDVLAVIDAAPDDDPRVSALDEVVHLLDPAALRARGEHIPADHPRRDALLDRAEVSAELATEDPRALADFAARLRELHGSGAGRWLRPYPWEDRAGDPGAGAEIDLRTVVRDRAAVVFSGPPALVPLVLGDLRRRAARPRPDGVGGLLWVAGIEALPAERTCGLVEAGRAAGLSLVASGSEMPEEFTDAVTALLVHRPADDDAAERMAERTGERYLPMDASGELLRCPLVPPAVLRTYGTGEFSLVVAAPRSRVVARARTVPGVASAPR